MAYATLQDLIARYGEEELIQLSDRLGHGSVDTTVIDQALADAGSVIDGHLAGRVALPLSPVPPILTAYCCDLTRERLFPDAPADHPVVRRGNEARKFLAQVAAGHIALGIQPDPIDGGVQMAEPRPRTWPRP